jgi:integrase
MINQNAREALRRQVYMSYSDAVKLFTLLPEWCRPIVQTIYYTGMRVGEAFGLKRDMVDLDKRVIFLRSGMLKESVWKKIPVHRELLPVLNSCLTATTRSEDRLFVIRDRHGVRPPREKSVKNSWRKACAEMNFRPCLRLADLRHTWRRNAERSQMPDSIAKKIMGHSTVNRRYGVEDNELVQAIDCLTFDHGKTRVIVSGTRSS